ncbi:MAG: MCP four helix bundle domain-containing protein [Burkholderiales bacterium]|nr:MCP four helix bundle domain-containing protein [Burkholderiales bacterium]
MNSSGTLTVGKRLGAVILTAVLGLAIVAGLATKELGRVYDAANFANVNVVPSLLALDEASDAVANLRVNVFLHILTSDSATLTTREKAMQDARSTVDAALKKYDPLIADDKDRQLLATDRSLLAQYDAVRTKVLALSKDKHKEEAAQLAEAEMAPAAAALAAAIVNHRVYNMELSDGGAKEGLAIMTSAKATLWGVGIATVLLSIALGLSTLRGLLRQLGGEPGYAAAIATEIAGGNLGVAVQLKDGDRTSLLYAMKTMCDSLANVVGNVRQSADGVATASMQIAQGNQDLSSRTEEQAGALEETAASMEELGGTVKQNADNAQQANQLAQGASSVAIKGGEVVDEVVRTMKDINDRSRKIVDIIGVIDGIAFQTNILALNAAVEAARAGEQGRGFAVVAGEVRNLAQRSAEAAKEIKSLITASVERVEQGTVLVDRAGTTMTEIVASIRRVTDIMGEISAASTEQSSGVAQVGQALAQMDQATQQNAALVEESAAAAESLKSQAQQLVQAVAVFKMAHAPGVAPASKTLGGPAPRYVPGRAAGIPPAGERRSPDRAKNVTRLEPAARPPLVNAAPVAVAQARTGTDDWESF